ncbi:unnamed protein product [Caenorhabditis sp. 36 PRJEB53466]|nr:unnamed protein product [Caenorhabditis sp. 36 PRJEB53466]
MTEIGGVSVPAAIAPLFSMPQSTIDDIQNPGQPFSYSRPTPGGPKLHQRIKCPRYNSPMGLYSKEAAVEQFQQQIGETPQDLPAQDKHFDPSKSATLKYLKEGERENFGENFFEKVAQAEAPRVPHQSEPAWARTAREKSERARSKTPADPTQAYRSGSSPAPSTNYPVHYESAREHAEKSKVFTHNVNDFGRSYWDAAPPEIHAEPVGPDANSSIAAMNSADSISPAVSTWIMAPTISTTRNRRASHSSRSSRRVGSGTDFYRGHVSGNSNYRGHGPDPPRLRPKYTADPHDPMQRGSRAQSGSGGCEPSHRRHTVNRRSVTKCVTSINQVRHLVRSPTGLPARPSHRPKVRRHAETARLLAFGEQISSPAPHRYPARPHRPNTTTACGIIAANSWRWIRRVNIRTLLNDDTARQEAGAVAVASWTWIEAYWDQVSARSDRRVPRYVDHWPKLTRKPELLDRPMIHISRDPADRQTPQPSIQVKDCKCSVGDTESQAKTDVHNGAELASRVDQRRLAWERRAFENEQRLSRPYSEKVAPGVPPAWHAEAQHKHQQWQQQADNMNTTSSQNYSTPPPDMNQSAEEEEDSESYHENRAIFVERLPPSQTHQNAQRQLNSGYNTNQVEYVLSHKDKYADGPHYQPPIVNSSSSYTTGQNQNYSSSSAQQQQTKTIPVQNYQSRREETSASVATLAILGISVNYRRSYEERRRRRRRWCRQSQWLRALCLRICRTRSPSTMFNKKTEMTSRCRSDPSSTLHNNTEGGYRDVNGHDVSYKRETQTGDPGRELLFSKEEEKRVVETPLEPGVISRTRHHQVLQEEDRH